MSRRMMGSRSWLTIFAAAFALNACATLEDVGLKGIGGHGENNYAAGSNLADQLTARDHQALESALMRAVNTGEARDWSGPRARGLVSPQGYAVANVGSAPGRRLALADPEIELGLAMETELGPHVLTRNTNLRAGPGTDRDVLDVLQSGLGIDVIGQLESGPWMLIAVDEIVRGYVHASLVTKAPGEELALAGGPVRRPVLCREFVQRMTVSGVRDQWRGAVCRENDRWVLAPEPPGPELLTDQDMLKL